MIIMYPMLVSQAVSENAIPGIAKTIESYILTYGHHALVSNSALPRNFSFKVKGKNLTLSEGALLEGPHQASPGEELGGAPGGTKTKKTSNIDKEKDIKPQAAGNTLDSEKFEYQKTKDEIERLTRERDRLQKIKDEREKEEKEERKKRENEGKIAKIDVKYSDTKTLSIEPTYIEIEVKDKNGDYQKKMLGIKCVPFRVKSDTKLSDLIVHDIQMKNLTASFIGIGRKIIKVLTTKLYSMIPKVAQPVLSPVMTGDPRKDILMGKSGFNGEGFIVLSRNEDIDEYFMHNVSKINRLQRMGWGNIVVADDINRVAYFCMKQARGNCFAVSYLTMYKNLGHTDVYKDLEDIKKQSSSVFKISRPSSKVFAEWNVLNKYDKYISEDTTNG